MKSSVQKLHFCFCYRWIHFPFEHWGKEKNLRDLARSGSKFWVEFSECQDTRGKTHLALGSLSCHVTVSEALRFPSDLEVCSPVRLSVCPCPDCELYFDELSLRFLHAWVMEEPESSKDWYYLFSLQPPLEIQGNLMWCNLCLAMPSNHVHSTAPMPCQALEASLKHACFLAPPWNWGTDLLHSKIPQIYLRIKPMFGCKAGLLFRGTGVSALLLTFIHESGCGVGRGAVSISYKFTYGYHFCINTVFCVLQVFAFEA